MTQTSHRESRVVAIAAERLFELVADVERYPEFIPLMREARIIRRHANGYETEQVLALGLLERRFRTHTELDAPRTIAVTSADRIFRRFDIRWTFTPTPESQCRIDFALDCDGPADGADHGQCLRAAGAKNNAGTTAQLPHRVITTF